MYSKIRDKTKEVAPIHWRSGSNSEAIKRPTTYEVRSESFQTLSVEKIVAHVVKNVPIIEPQVDYRVYTIRPLVAILS